MSFSIEPAEINDAAALDHLVNSAYRGDSSRLGWTTEADLLDGGRVDVASLEEILRSPGNKILKYLEGVQILGCVYLHRDDEKLYLGMLSVQPRDQNKGIGKKLLAAAEQEAVKLGCISIYMTVISIRKELINWYVRHGYRLTGEKKPFTINDPRFGLPKSKLEFVVLEKKMD